jgi:hypothetical protein
VGVEVRQARSSERRHEDHADRRGARIVLPRDADSGELAVRVLHNLRCREKRVVEAPELLFKQVLDPVDHDLRDVVAHREEPRREGLARLRLDLPGVLLDLALDEVDGDLKPGQPATGIGVRPALAHKKGKQAPLLPLRFPG